MSKTKVKIQQPAKKNHGKLEFDIILAIEGD